MIVTSEARRAVAVIRECLANDRFAVSVQFAHRMEQRGLFWPDIQAVVEDPSGVWAAGMDRDGRPEWIIAGDAGGLGEIEIVCAIECDDSGTEFITLYWED